MNILKIFKKNKKFWKNVLLFSIGVIVLLIGILLVWLSSLKIPDFTSFEERKIINSTKIYDRTGETVLYDIHQDVKRTNVPFAAMSINIKNATVAVEDSEFYNHNGIRITSIIRATIVAKLTGKKISGASTITQQLVKNTILTSNRSISRKIKEWVLAVKIDKALPKEKILELYLNEVPYGGTVYGIQEASKTYFNKNASDLDLAEAAYLASIPQSPTVLSPYGKNIAKLNDRKNFVLSRMHELKFITDDEYKSAKEEVVAFVPQQIGGIKAPHFVFFIKDYLETKYGSEMVEKGGLKVTTTLDYNLEQKAEQFVKDGALENEKNWNGKNAALVAIDPKTGQILSMVGSRDYFDKAIDGNFNVATASRQPGSSFKPFIYATAFNEGFTPDTILFDLPTEFQSTCDAYGKALKGHKQSDCYMPDDYDGKALGPMSLRDALAQSRNIPAVQLFYLSGTKKALKTAQDMGITTLTDISRYGLTLVIGGGEVSLLDITSAYGVFADSGVRNEYTGILKVEDSSGKVLEEYKQNAEEVLPKNTALLVSDILSDENARIPTFGKHSDLFIPGKDVAVKTGTTNNNKDAWTVGYSPSLVVGVWAGNNDNTPMKKGGVSVAGPIWNKFITEALKDSKEDNFESPNTDTDPTTVKPVLRGLWQGNENFFIDKISGNLAGPNTPKETIQEKIITNVHSILYWVDKNNVTGLPPTNPQSDPQFNHFEIPVLNWWEQNKSKYPIVTYADKPGQIDNTHDDASKPVVTILEPNTTKIYPQNQKINLKIESSGPYPLVKIDVFVNDVYLGSSESPFNFSFTPSEVGNLQTNNELKIVAYNSIYSTSETTLFFKISQ